MSLRGAADRRPRVGGPCTARVFHPALDLAHPNYRTSANQMTAEPCCHVKG